MAHTAAYQGKLITAAQAAGLVNSGDLVDYGFFNGKPAAIDQALAARAGELEGVDIYAAVTLPPIPLVATQPQSFTYHDFQYSQLTRLMAAQSPALYYVPILYHYAPALLRSGIGPRRRIGFFQVCPMDGHGWFNLGPQNSETRAKMERDEIVVVEVNQNMPVCLGGAEENVHLDQVDYVVEAPPGQAPFGAPDLPGTPEEEAIARQLLGHIIDGACIQLGIGGLPNLVGKLIAESDLKDLGGHTEMFCGAYVDMLTSGRMTGAKKAFDRGRVAYTFAIGSEETYRYLDRNPALASYPVNYTNDPRVIAGLDNFISICNAVEVDLYSQVNAESSGFKQISGNGGMWDFVLGSQWSRGGKSFICLTSTYNTRDGVRRSRIVPHFAPGSIATIPRQMVDYLVTEYGVARMHGQPTWARAEMLVNLAHPEFRDELVAAAEKQGIWRRSNQKA
ncbi:MAG: acetyl-CoA hydrolase [Deltaproteobacteria bacterium]|nr:acetyl-CoA hydrolase [Deltaproteobacteria bacterium]